MSAGPGPPSAEVERRRLDVGMSRDRMVLTLGHRRWSRFFEVEAIRVAEALRDQSPRIEHIGSTAVPGLLAKPIVDIGGAVDDVDDVHAVVPDLEALGYQYRGQNGDDPLRRYFVLETGRRRVVQLHLWSQRASAWREALAFRDLLRGRPDLRKAYAEEKRRAAAEVGWKKGAYSIAKSAFVAELLDLWVR